MHIPTHILSGWVVGNCVPLDPRQRLACMIAATVADLDGISILLGRGAYDRYHHILCHGLPFGLLVTIVLVAWTRTRARSMVPLGVVYLGLFHLHLVMDYWGSGAGWPIAYLYPFSGLKFVNWNGWELTSWQNQLAAGILLLITLWIGWRLRRTPLELLMPSLDAKFTGRPETPR
jgi:hypothetical protein